MIQLPYTKLLALALALVLLAGATAASADTIYGTIRHQDVVEAGATDVYTVTVIGGRAAKVEVKAAMRGDLDLFIYDSQGQLVTWDVRPSENAKAKWYPSRTGTYLIAIRNLGHLYNPYTLTIH